MKESDVRRIVRDEIKKLDLVPRKPRKRLPKGLSTGDSITAVNIAHHKDDQ